MKILLMGQCTLHWGRLEFGNIGNYYIIEPFIRELHRVFPKAEIRTTFQMTERFCQKEQVTVLPMDVYYGWGGDDLDIALHEMELATQYFKTGTLPDKTTPYIEEVLQSDLVIDFSGDIWGDNADFLGDNRFLVGLYKDKIAQLLQKPVVMLAGSPGPFTNEQNRNLAKEVFKEFKLVINREPISSELLDKEGFDLSETLSLACPSFLFDGAPKEEAQAILLDVVGEKKKQKPLVGFILCGWNFIKGPFDQWPRDDKDYEVFVEVLEAFSQKVDANICLMSHSNGFNVPPSPFELHHGRDYGVIKQLQRILQERNIQNIFALDGVYDAWQTKSIIGEFDMLISGRVHGAIAGISQAVPTVFIDYGHEPKAHKIRGFARVAEVEKYVANPGSKIDLLNKVLTCWESKEQYKQHLKVRIPEVQAMAKKGFDLLEGLI